MIKRIDSSDLSWRIKRAGGVLRSLLMVLCGGALLAGAALILEPAALIAVTRPPEPRSTTLAIHEEFANSLAGLMSECLEVLAVHNHSTASQAAIVLWMHDDTNPGVIDPAEVTVIAHSQLLRTITVYVLEEGHHETVPQQTSSRSADQPQVSGSPTVRSNQPLRLSGPLDRAAVSTPVFCDRWRATPAVQPRTIASGISDMRFETISGSRSPQDAAGMWQLWLRWSPDSADGAGEASAFITPGSRRET